MVSEYERIVASLANYDLPEKEELIQLIWEEVNGKSLEDIIWKEEGGKAKPMGFYYDGGWHRIEEYPGNEIKGIEVIRKAKNALSDKTEEELAPEYWRIRKIKFKRKENKMVPIGNWREYPTEVTKIVRETVKEVYDELIKEYPFFEITLFGSAANGSMKNGSDVEYAFIIDGEKLVKSKKYNQLYNEISKKSDVSFADWLAKEKTKHQLQKEFERKIVEKAKNIGLNISIGYSYITYKEADGTIYDPYGPSRKKHWRVLYMPNKISFIRYNEILKK